MRKYLGLFLLLMVAVWSFNAFSGIRFIVDSEAHTKRDKVRTNYISPSVKNCRTNGYTKTSCNSSEQAVERCPYDRRYFKYCCPSGYAHKKKDCTEQGLIPSKSSCHGYYRCEYPE